MFDIMKTNEWNDMFRQMDALMQYPFGEKTIETRGLRSLIHRPHNIVNITDKDGNVTGQRLEVVTTPFKKDDVSVQVSGNTLTVKCGTEADEFKPLSEDGSVEKYLYKGISSQYYTFSLKLSENIDKNAIKAKNQDGVLTIMLPFKTEIENSDTVKITVE